MGWWGFGRQCLTLRLFFFMSSVKVSIYFCVESQTFSILLFLAAGWLGLEDMGGRVGN